MLSVQKLRNGRLAGSRRTVDGDHAHRSGTLPGRCAEPVKPGPVVGERLRDAVGIGGTAAAAAPPRVMIRTPRGRRARGVLR